MALNQNYLRFKGTLKLKAREGEASGGRGNEKGKIFHFITEGKKLLEKSSVHTNLRPSAEALPFHCCSLKHSLWSRGLERGSVSGDKPTFLP